MNGKETVNQNNFITAPFSDVGYNTTDIQNLKLVGSSGYMGDTFQIWEGLPSVVDGASFAWLGTEWNQEGTIATKGMWADGSGLEAIFSIPAGQAVTIGASASGIGIENAGQVPTEKVEFTMEAGNNFTGNPFPTQIDIQNIKLIGSSGYMGETFQIWEGLPSVVDGASFAWLGTEWNQDGTIATKGMWVDGSGQEVNYPLNPYQGCAIFASSAGIKVEITPPYDLAK